ncbi:MAG: lipoprotein-releasing ABC transporter permease subunit [Proteobacteria bacterium]|nr:lipoprotein-releasing ABC transporter permease subunit [Pseudomonadota bacterium]MBU4470676.1 lipoprotein-releasing ABC transporter permease subunit [Pseudomonadota bacterium]MCG2751229.1 lipoprotein-releasing ABC transporter permease subunit [Desulfobacteraceae bacterium]
MSFEFFISRRYLKSKQKQAFISLITLLSIAGVTIGVMALIVVIGVMAGFESDMKSRILGVESHMVVFRYGGDFKDYKKIIEKISQYEEVDSATPFVFTQVMMRSSSGIAGVMLRGIEPETAGKVVKVLDETSLQRLSKTQTTVKGEGDPSETGNPGISGVILGKELAKTLDLSVNDMVSVISTRGMISPVGIIPSMKRFKVVGQFESGIYDYDGSIAYIHMADVQKILKMEGAVTGIEVRLKDAYKAKAVAAKIEKELGYPYWARDWTQMNQTLFSALKLEKTVMFIILTLIVLVAAFNIASTLIMVVMEKTRDIAILKAMGASNGQVRKIFVLKGLMIGAVGTFVGEFLGYGLCFLLKRYEFIELPADIYYLSTLPVEVDFLDTLIIAVASMVICYLATLYPAHQASKLNPVDALRYG